MVQMGQIRRIVGEIGIHLDHEVVIAIQCPFESMDIGCAQSEFTLSAFEIHASRILGHLPAHLVGCAVGRSVIDHKKIKTIGKSHDCVDHPADVFDFIIGRYYYKNVAHRLINYCVHHLGMHNRRLKNN